MHNFKLDFEETLRFFRWLAPGGPWFPCAILPNTPGHPQMITAALFFPGEEQKLESWLQEHHDKQWNLYFHVNFPDLASLGHPPRKLRREQVAEARYFHADVDPPKDKPSNPEELLAKVMKFEPRPHAAWISGNGCNLLWRPDKFLDAKKDPAAIPAWEDINRALGEALGGDKSVIDIGHILRLPGSTNIPSESKLRLGRVIVPTGKVQYWPSCDPDATYPLSDLRALVKNPLAKQSESNFVLDINWPPERILDLNELSLNPTLAAVICSGIDPEKPDRWAGDRSAAVYWVACECARKGTDPNVLASILMDPQFRISDHVLAQSNPKRTVEKTLVKAYTAASQTIEAEGDLLSRLNDEWAFVEDWGGKVMMLQERVDLATGRPEILRKTTEDFCKILENQPRIPVGKKSKLLSKWWLEHPQRRSYHGVELRPNIPCHPSRYNLWQGFFRDPAPGNMHESLLAHIRDIICSGSAEANEYILSWVARMFQKPASPGETIIVLRGKQGTGKNTFTEVLVDLLQPHSQLVDNAKLITGNFTSILEDCIFLLADEAFFAGDGQAADRLKSLATNPRVTIHHKGLAPYSRPNFLHIVASSNHDWVAPIDIDDRRYVVLDVADTRRQDDAYFGQIRKDLDNGGRENFLHYMLKRDITQFNVRAFPRTKARANQQQLSLPPIARWFKNRLCIGTVVDHQESWEDPVICDDVRADYRDFTKSAYARHNDSVTLGSWLAKYFPHVVHKQVRGSIADRKGNMDPHKKKYIYLFGSLKECQRLFDLHFEGPHEYFNGQTLEEAEEQEQRERAEKRSHLELVLEQPPLPIDPDKEYGR